MFICRKTDGLVVRRIEHKMGIHGVPTAELQYNHVPAELCGKRKMGLIRYVMSLMNGARVAISAQALGIAEAAFREARQYASERQQFKQTIDAFPAIYDMLARMKANLVAVRTLLYETTKAVDLRNCYTRACDDPAKQTAETREKMKYYTEIASVLTPMSKAFSTEAANSICYDCLQIHGGTGYMHDFDAERLYRDVRITNIYEGTTQLQVVAAIGGIMKRSLDKRMDELFAGIPAENEFAAPLRTILLNMYDEQHEAVKYIAEKKDPDYYSLRARNLVEHNLFPEILTDVLVHLPHSRGLHIVIVLQERLGGYRLQVFATIGHEAEYLQEAYNPFHAHCVQALLHNSRHILVCPANNLHTAPRQLEHCLHEGHVADMVKMHYGIVMKVDDIDVGSQCRVALIESLIVFPDMWHVGAHQHHVARREEYHENNH